MRSARSIAVTVLAVVTFGSLLLTGGAAWHVRSAGYRKSCASQLSRSLGLPAEIGRVVPRSRTAREFQQVRIWLPEKRGEAALCERALVTQTPTAEQPEAYELELRGGHCEISTRTWLRGDYRAVLESGLRPGFDPDGPRRVVFHGMDLSFEREQFRAGLDDAGGVVLFDDPHVGRATVTCRQLNGYAAPEPVTLRAEFSPQARGIRLDRVELTVPELPIAIVGLKALTGLDLQTGTFGGRVVYRETGSQRELSVSGRVKDVQLAECTGAFLSPAWRGRAPDVELMELAVVDGVPQWAAFRGIFTDVALGDILAAVGLQDIDGDVVLRIQSAELSPDGVDRFVASGRCARLSLDRLTAALGWGRMSGQARLVIDDLTVESNRLASLDAEIIVEPTGPESDWIERNLLSEVLRRTIGFALPSFLPDRFEYTQLGVRLEVRDETLYVFGTHGAGQKTILSVRIGEQELPVVPEPERPIDLRPLCNELRARLTAQLAGHLRRLKAEAAATE
ncbi:MAG TPA: hypothetical protein PLP66_02825 [Phycisphaerae bacterium]|nr:hypothetical protein [Phycisphaerae bacterium]